MLALALLPALAHAQIYHDVFASNGNQAAEGAAEWWERHTDEFRTTSNCCLTWLQEAYARQQMALALYEAARNTTGDESRELQRQGAEQINLRTDLLARFKDCVNDANRARRIAQQGGDPTGIMPAGCGARLSDVFSMDDGLGAEVARDWYLYEIPPRVRARARCCIDLLEDAQETHERAIRQLGESEASGLTPSEREALVAKAQKSLHARTRFLTRFHKCVQQAARSLGITLPSSELAAASAATEQASDEPVQPRSCRKFELGAEKYGPDVEVGDGGEAPDEPGVDWDGWYKKWIDLVRLEVFAEAERAFAKDPNTYECYVDYTVFPDGRVVINAGSNCTGSYNRGLNYGRTIQPRLINLRYPKLPDGTILLDPTKKPRTPPFPEGTKRTQVRRFFTFKHNLGPKGMKLGGPPGG